MTTPERILRRAADPSTPSAELVRLFNQADAWPEARPLVLRNPNFPSDALQLHLESGDLDAWRNPARATLLFGEGVEPAWLLRAAGAAAERFFVGWMWVAEQGPARAALQRELPLLLATLPGRNAIADVSRAFDRIFDHKTPWLTACEELASRLHKALGARGLVAFVLKLAEPWHRRPGAADAGVDDVASEDDETMLHSIWEELHRTQPLLPP